MKVYAITFEQSNMKILHETNSVENERTSLSRSQDTNNHILGITALHCHSFGDDTPKSDKIFIFHLQSTQLKGRCKISVRTTERRYSSP